MHIYDTGNLGVKLNKWQPFTINVSVHKQPQMYKMPKYLIVVTVCYDKIHNYLLAVCLCLQTDRPQFKPEMSLLRIQSFLLKDNIYLKTLSRLGVRKNKRNALKARVL